MTWQKFTRDSRQSDDDVRARGRGLMSRRGRKLFEGTVGQNLSRTRGPRAQLQGWRSEEPGVRVVAYGDDQEGVVGRLLCYSLPLKVLHYS